ncbi:MAG: DKNYY domain-containing protein [Patescibacteria group bacterium]|nr:DKNYY domain-containing protein [Patescibacteria group bacterium]MDE1945093.1 DKNYY domain-containing protein [Patescibacteria group bacterium]MDE2057887.1 DKNYY domain-containing protein [Patescibacteria group bacterium]
MDTQPRSGAYQKVAGADAATFQDLTIYGLCFGKDKSHVYRGGVVIAGADPATFSLLWYAKPGPVLFFRNDTGITKFSFSADENSAFVDSSPVVSGDAASFVELNPNLDFSPYAKDRHNVYCNGSVILGADPATAKLSSSNLSVSVDGSTRTYDSTCKAAGTGPVVSGLETYANAQYGFSLQYPSDVPAQTTGYGSVPTIENPPEAYFNVVDGADNLEGYLLASVVPLDKLQGENGCTKTLGTAATTINDIAFTQTSIPYGDVGNSTYATVRNGLCYQLDIFMFQYSGILAHATVNGDAGQAYINAKLEPIIQSFRFTN